jgi:hypothetical protein
MERGPLWTQSNYPAYCARKAAYRGSLFRRRSIHACQKFAVEAVISCSRCWPSTVLLLASQEALGAPSPRSPWPVASLVPLLLYLVIVGIKIYLYCSFS